jgi:predicted nucleotidyltransferase
MGSRSQAELTSARFATARPGDGCSKTFLDLWTLRVFMDTFSEQNIRVHLPFPFGNEQVFRYEAMEDVLELLIRNPFREFTVRRLRAVTDNGSKTTTRAVDLLQQLRLVRVDESGRSRDVSLNRERVTMPDDALFAVPQDEFRKPLREFAVRARTEVPSFSALIVFGSVARGEADRQSDIDVWILIDDNDDLLRARRAATDISAELGEERFGEAGERYEFEVLVESVESAVSHGEADDGIVDVLTEGVVLEDSDELERVTDVVLGGADAAEVLGNES